MIGEWMLYQCAVALLLGLAAIAGERLLGIRHFPLRGVWVASLIASVAFPALMTSMEHRVLPGLSAMQAVAIRSAPVPRSRPAPALPLDNATPELSRVSHAVLPRALAHPSEPVLRKLEQPLKWTWLTLTLATVTFYGMAMLALARTARRWPRQEVDGILVRVAPTAGPAVLGYLNPEIVLPRWLLSAPPCERALVLAHERAHIQARDPLLRLGALLLIAAVPWSIPLWWQLRRLLFSIEVDCDARVLGAGAGIEEYGNALVAVCRRRVLMPLGSMSMAAHSSSIERRLLIMVEPQPKRPRRIVAMALVLIAGCLGAAVTFPAPSRLSDAVLELPPTSDVPFFMAKAEAVARGTYPSLFEGNLQGTEVIAVDLDIDGRLLDIERGKFSSGPLSTNHVPFELAVDEHDVWRISGARGLKFIGWFGSHHDEGLYVSYRVLMWPHDPSRTAERVQAAVAARYPEYFRAYPASEASIPARTMSVFMSDDGTIRRASAPSRLQFK